MSNTTKTVPTKTPLGSTNFWTGIATVIAAGFAIWKNGKHTGTVETRADNATETARKSVDHVNEMVSKETVKLKDISNAENSVDGLSNDDVVNELRDYWTRPETGNKT